MTTLSEFIVQAKGWPTSLDVCVGTCCALHRTFAVSGIVHGGCSDWERGSHASVAALYGDVPSYVCHAEKGALVLDGVLRHQLSSLPYGLVKQYPPSRRFFQRFAQGYPISVSAYGAGYCYLTPVIETARSRLARLLGPNPLLVDVIRAWVFFSQVCVSDVEIVSVCGGYYHVQHGGCVASDVVDVRLSGLLPQSVRVAMQVVLDKGPWVRVGAQSDSLLEDAKLEFDRVCIASPVRYCSKGFLSYYGTLGYEGVDKLVGVDLCQKLVALNSWFLSCGIDLPVRVLSQVVVATFPLAAVPAEGIKLRKLLRLWALLGDVSMKVVFAMAVSANFEDVSDYAVRSALASNVSLAAALQTSGLRDLCQVNGLAVTSKANADIFEAIVGVLSVNCSLHVVEQFLSATSVIRGSVIDDGKFVERAGFDGQTEIAGLNSWQYAKALELVRNGQL